MKLHALLLICLLGFGSMAFAQKSGSQEMGGGVSLWMTSANDTSETNLDFVVLWATYINRNFLFELEPRATLHFVEDDLEITGLLLGNFAFRLIDISPYDRYGGSAWQRKHERSTGSIYASAGGGLWAERDHYQLEEKIYTGPALSAAIGTTSLLGSLTFVRTKFQYVYMMPAPPVYEEPRSMFTISVMLSVLTRI